MAAKEQIFLPSPPPDNDESWFSRFVEKIQEAVSTFLNSNKSLLTVGFWGLLLCLFHAYLGYALSYNFQKAIALLVLTILAWALLLYTKFKPIVAPYLEAPAHSTSVVLGHLAKKRIFQILFPLIITAAIIVFLIIDTQNDRYRLVSLGGWVFFVVILFIFSTNPAKVRWRPVFVGFLVQFIIALIVLRWPAGLSAFQWLAAQVVVFLDYTAEGTNFVYGFLVSPPPICGMNAIFYFAVLQVVIYFGAVVGLLYHLGVMQWILLRMAWFVNMTLGTTAAESLNACACVFLGQSEAPIMIKPYLIKLTKSELHALMVAGFSCIAGSLFAAYISFGACSEQLLSASFMAAPSSLAVSKLFCPETEESQTKEVSSLELPPGDDRNVLEAVSNGATSVVSIVVNIAANLVIFLALLAFVNNIFRWLGGMVGIEDLTFERVLAYGFFPFAFIMGVSDQSDWDKKVDETMIVAELMGTKTVLNEFIAYQDMSNYVAEGRISGRAQMMATYALCSFANIGSIGIQMGTISGICPEKKPDVVKLIVRALIAGSITSFMNACMAGILITTPTTCQPKSAGMKCFNVSAYIE